MALALGLTGCGGGDGSSTSSAVPSPGPAPSPAPAPGPAPSPAPVPTPAPSPASSPIANKSCQAFPSGTGGSVGGSLAGKASSPAGRSLSFSLVTQPPSGNVLLNSATGAFSYTRSSPARGDVDSFAYRVTDSAGLTAESTAQVIYGRRRIMPLGDSITEGVESFNSTTGDLPAVPLRVGYRKALGDRLAEEGYAVDFVGSRSGGSGAGLVDDDHEGYPGAGQADLASGITSWLGLNPPDLVLLHIGTNDVPGNTSAAATSNLLSQIDTWTANTSNPPVRLLLARIIGQRSGTPDVATFNANLTSLYDTSWADPAGVRPRFVVRMVDMYSKLNNTTDLSDPAADSVGLHPNPTGYAKMAAAWFDSLVQTGAVHKCP